MVVGRIFHQVRRLWSKQPVNQRAAFVITIPAACLVTTLVAWGWSRGQVAAANQWVEQTQAIIAESDALFLSLLDAESSIRGFTLARDSKFLAPYNRAIATLPKIQERLRQLVETGAQRQRLQKLEQLVQLRLQRFEQRLIRIQQRPPTDFSFLQSDSSFLEGETLKTQIRELLEDFKAEEQQILVARQERLAQIQGTTNMVIVTLAFLSLFSSGTAMYLFNGLNRELRERETHLRESKFLIQAIVGNVVDGVITLDQQGQIETVNSSLLTMFGYDAEELLGQPLTDLLSGPQESSLSQEPLAQDQVSEGKKGLPAWERISQALPSYRQEMKAYRRQGDEFLIELSISSTEIADQLIAIVRDITERKESEARLKVRAEEMLRLNRTLARTNRELKHRNRELDQFAYVASHDLKAPLRAIANLSEWIEEDLADQLPAENRQQMELLRGRVHRMEALINGLLEYSRIGRTSASPERVDVYSLVMEAVESLGSHSGFTIEVAADLPTLMSRRMPLFQVFTNLISNAIKHHDREQGRVQVSAVDQGDVYEFVVADDGPGIEPRYHEKVFTMFQTLMPRDTKESTGIGLAIVKKIVENEGGTVSLSSTLGQGAAFYFTWPKVPPDPQFSKSSHDSVS